MPSPSAADAAPADLLEHARALLRAELEGQSQTLFFKHELTYREQYVERGKPFPYLRAIAALLPALGARVIVELGSMRKPMVHPIEEGTAECCADGHSTAFWARTQCTVHTVDIDPACHRLVSEACAAFPRVRAWTGDGIAFLTAFRGEIDFLYLDAWDVAAGEPYAERHLAAYEAARDKLALRALIAIDDTDLMFGGKGRLAIPAMIRDGFELIVLARQALLLRAG